MQKLSDDAGKAVSTIAEKNAALAANLIIVAGFLLFLFVSAVKVSESLAMMSDSLTTNTEKLNLRVGELTTESRLMLRVLGDNQDIIQELGKDGITHRMLMKEMSEALHRDRNRDRNRESIDQRRTYEN